MITLPQRVVLPLHHKHHIFYKKILHRLVGKVPWQVLCQMPNNIELLRYYSGIGGGSQCGLRGIGVRTGPGCGR